MDSSDIVTVVLALFTLCSTVAVAYITYLSKRK